jgi:hypothetical protein
MRIRYTYREGKWTRMHRAILLAGGAPSGNPVASSMKSLMLGRVR